MKKKVVTINLIIFYSSLKYLFIFWAVVIKYFWAVKGDFSKRPTSTITLSATLSRNKLLKYNGNVNEKNESNKRKRKQVQEKLSFCC